MLSVFPKMKVRFIGTLFKRNSARVIGHDGAYSVPLKDGRVFWSFGDTILGPERRGYNPQKMTIEEWIIKDPWAQKNVSMISNSGLIAEAEDIRDLTHKGFKYFVHEKEVDGKKLIEAREIISIPDEIRGKGMERIAFWPFDGIEVNSKLYVFYLMVKCVNLSLNVYGTGLACSLYPYKTFERIKSIAPMPPKGAPKNEESYIWWDNTRYKNQNQMPCFGTAVLKKIIDGYVYIYGSKLEKRNNQYIAAVSLARVKKNSIEDITKYEYLTEAPSEKNDFEPRWDDNPRKTAVLFDGNANELSVSYNPYLGKYLAIYSYAGTLHKKGKKDQIHMRVAEKPEGPWSSPIKIYEPKRSLENDICYAGKEHPEYSKDGKKIYVTYVSHQRYFPELLEIEFEK